MLSLQALFSRFEKKFFWYKGGKLWKDHLKRSVYTVCFATKGPATYRCATQRCTALCGRLGYAQRVCNAVPAKVLCTSLGPQLQ